MVSSNVPDDVMSLASGFTANTPPTEPTIMGDLREIWDGRVSAVPWPNNSYIILEKNSDRAIALKNGELVLQDMTDGDIHANNRWLCVEKSGYFGFYNSRAGVYMGHTRKYCMCATAREMKKWELLTVRQHPEGGFQLLSPFYDHTLLTITVAEDGKSLARAQHGETLWEFIKV